MKISTLLLSLTAALVTSTFAAKKPNIIFVMVDDAGIGDFSPYGGELIKTPVMQKMAKQGMLFNNAYSGNAVCGPTRCVLMTGLHPGHAVRRANGSKIGPLPLTKDCYTVATMLQSAGYATGGFGKWGLGNVGTTGVPEAQGFDYWYGYYDQRHAHDYYPEFLVRNSQSIDLPGNKNGKKEQYTHYLIEDETIKFIEQNKDKPFFCYAAWTPPHGKFQIPADEPALKLYANKPWKQNDKTCAAMITMLDRGVGRIIKKCEELGIAENTLIIYTSDNGCHAAFAKTLKSNGGLRGVKRSLYEGGIRAPFVAYWPKTIPAGTKTDALTSGVDLMATAAEIAGLPTPKHQDGISILPVLKGGTEKKVHDSLYFELYEGRFQQCVRMGKWKGYRKGTKDPVELYDLSSDPKESDDIAAKHPEIAQQIDAIMTREHVPSKHYNTPENAGNSEKKKKKNKKADKRKKKPQG